MTGRPWKKAAGLFAAWRRSATVIRPKSSEVAPLACMYRVAKIAAHWAGVTRPNGVVHEYETSSASTPVWRPATPEPKRRHDRSLKAR